MTKSNLSRRQFGKNAGAILGTTALATGPALNVLGANERIHVGVIGCGNRGQYDTSLFMRFPNVKISALCDVDSNQFDEKMGRHFADQNDKPKTYSDFRELLEHPDLNVAIIATPDHWHALPFIMACQAGLDVYSEKPVALTIDEGRKMVEAAHSNNRITQIGTQQRSNEHFQEAVRLIRSGYLGHITYVEAWNVSRRWPEGMGNPPDTSPPSSVDYDMWLGPAPKRPFNLNRFHGSWRWFWDYSGGQMTDWGTHHIDIIQWALGKDYPKSAVKTGGKYALTDSRETPDTFNAIFEYEGGTTLQYFNRMCNDKRANGQVYGTEFHGTLGKMFINRGGYVIEPFDDQIEPLKASGSDKTDVHIKNFLDCVKTRTRCISDIAITHRSTSTSHLGNIAYWLDEKLHWDGKSEKFTNNPEANQFLTREYRSPWTIG